LNLKEEQKSLSEQDILNSLKTITSDLASSIKKNMDEIQVKLNSFSQHL